MLINIDRIADLCGSTRRTVIKRLKDLPRQKGDGRSINYESTDALPIMFGMGKPSDKSTLEKQRTRLASAQAEKIELELEVIKGDLIPAEQVRSVVDSMVSAFRSRMLSLPIKAAPVVVTMADALEAEKILRDHVYEALNELSNYESKAGGTSTDQSVSETRRAPAPPNRKPVGGQQEETKQGSKRRTRPVEH